MSAASHPIEAQLHRAGIQLPEPAKPAANYVPYVVHRGLVTISGQLPMQAGSLAYTGKVNGDADIARAQEAARLCGVNLLAQLRAALENDWSRFERVIRLGIFVNAPAGFEKAHLVANGVSDFIADMLGDAGKHARSTVCVSELPFGALVEVEGLFAAR